MALSILPADHPYRNAAPTVPATWTPAQIGSLVLDSWDYAKLVLPGDDGLARPMYQTTTSIADKYMSTACAASAAADVRLKRHDTEPYAAIASSRGPRRLKFANGAYVSTGRDLRRGVSFTGATSTRPLRIAMSIGLLGSATRTGSGTLWACGGWNARVAAGGGSIVVTSDRATTDYDVTFPWPEPEEGRALYWMEWTWTGAAWTFNVNGEAVASTASTAGSGAYTSPGSVAMTFGGEASHGYECEIDFATVYMGASQLDNISKWRWDTAVTMSWGSTHYHNLADTPEEDAYYKIFQGSDGNGLAPYDINLFTDTNSAGEWWIGWQQSANRLGLIRLNGYAERNITSQATSGVKNSNRQVSHGAFINVSGGFFAFCGAELRLSYNASDVEHTLIKGVIGGGPTSYGSQYQGEGTPFGTLGQTATAGTGKIKNFIVKDCASYHSCDTSFSGFYGSENVLALDFVTLAPARNSNHGESPNHDFGSLVGNASTKWSFVGCIWANINQRTPTLLGSQGNGAALIDAKAESVGCFIRPQNDRSRNYGGAVFGQASNNPGANMGNAFLSMRSIIFESEGTTNTPTANELAIAKTQTVGDGITYPENLSRIHFQGVHKTTGTVTTHDSGYVSTRPKWSGGGRLHPTAEADLYAAIVTERMAREPTYGRTLLASYQTGDIVRNDIFVSNPGNLNPGTGGNEATLDGLKNPTTTNWQAKANFAAAPSEFPNTVTAWGSITNGTSLQALLGVQTAGATLWPLVAEHVLS